MKIFIKKQIKENLKFSSELILFIGLYNYYPKEPKHYYNSENKSRYFPLLEYYDKYIQYTIYTIHLVVVFGVITPNS